jgi:hypothetical protein
MGLTAQQQASAWKWLKEQTQKIPDPILRNTIMAEFRKRAQRDWGYCPDNWRGVAKTESVELDDWEKQFVDDIKKSQLFDLDVREEKRNKEINEAKARMRDFIERGGELTDIPEDIRTPFITKLYYESLIQDVSLLIERADALTKDTK